MASKVRPVPKGHHTATPYMPFTRLDGIHVLVVDDNRDARQILAKVLRHSGAVITTTGSAQRALRLVQHIVPHVIISDLAMPTRANGQWLIKEIRAHAADRTRSIPAIAMTAYGEIYGAERAAADGFDAFVEKPIDLGHICALISQLARSRRVR